MPWIFFYLKDNDGVIDLQEMANIIETLESLDNITSNNNNAKGKYLYISCWTSESLNPNGFDELNGRYFLAKNGLNDDFEDSNSDTQV